MLIVPSTRILHQGYRVALPPANQTGHRWIQTESAPDEIIIPFELRERGAPINDTGPTFVCWHCEALGGTSTGSTHPSTFVSMEGAVAVCQRARREGYWFVRKVG